MQAIFAQSFLLGIIETPSWRYWLFYLVVGIISFAICYFNRFFIIVIVPIILLLCWRDLLNISPYISNLDKSYMPEVYAGMTFSILFPVIGAILNWRKQKSKSEQLP